MVAAWVKWVLAAVVVVALGVIGYSGWSVWTAYRTVEGISQLEFDPVQTRAELRQDVEAEPPEQDPVASVEEERADQLRTFLIVGDDNRPGFGGNRADVILMGLLPPGEGSPILFSIPRDLYIPSPCTGASVRINTLLSGCGTTATGPEVLAVAVEDFTGTNVNHFALIDFAGFEEIVDAFGGVQICLEYAIRDDKVNYEGVILPAGCSIADGAQALAWVRSRRTLEYVEGIGWRTQPGVNDLVRNERQQQLLFALLARVGRLRDITRLVGLAESVADAVVVDEGLSVTEGVGLVWGLRGLAQEDVIQLTVPVEYHTTPNGASVLRPIGDFADLVRQTLAGVVAEADSA
ncbi:MAG: LCP family protein [Acidimicrobiia bacterium]